MSDNKKLGAAERVFRSLLKLFPFDFRSNYGRELEQVFREQRREAREGKGPAAIRLWSRTIRGVFSTALSEHLAIFGRDARYGVRTLLQSPTFTMAVVVTLMVGIGANTAIFSVVNGVLLRSLPYDEPERLVRVYETNDGTIDVGGYLTGLDFVDYRDSGIFDGLASFYDYQDTGFDLGGNGNPIRVSSLRISAGYFEVLRSKPLLGRTFESGDETAAPLTVLGEGLWRRHFGGIPDILGRQILLDAVPYTVIGVMPRGLKGPNGSDTDLWIPLNLQPGGFNSRGNHYLSAVGRLKPLAGLQGTQNEVNRLAARLADENDGFNEGRSARLVPLHDSLIAETRPMLYILLGAVGLVLLIGCANVANLFLARGSNRQQELAIRAALGSGRARLVRQLLTENIILAGIGGLGGLALAYVGVRLLLAIGPDTLPLTETVVFDRQVFAFVGVLSLATGFLFGLIPALQASRPNVNGFLAAGGRRLSSGKRQQRFSASFVLAQVALALILVVGAGLLIRSFNKLVDVDLGFETDQVLTFAINLPNGRYGQADQRTAFYRTYYEQINSLPGVESAGSVSKLPASGECHIWGVQVVGREDGENEGYRAANIRCFDGEYFESLGITLLEGRLPDERDRSDSAMVIVVNSELSLTFLSRRKRPGPEPSTRWRTAANDCRNCRRYAARSFRASRTEGLCAPLPVRRQPQLDADAGRPFKPPSRRVAGRYRPDTDEDRPRTGRPRCPYARRGGRDRHRSSAVRNGLDGYFFGRCPAAGSDWDLWSDRLLGQPAAEGNWYPQGAGSPGEQPLAVDHGRGPGACCRRYRAGNRGCVLVGALSLITGVRGQRDRSDNDGHQHIGVGCGRGRRRGLPGMVGIENRSEHGVEKGIDQDQPQSG